MKFLSRKLLIPILMLATHGAGYLNGAIGGAGLPEGQISSGAMTTDESSLEMLQQNLKIKLAAAKNKELQFLQKVTIGERLACLLGAHTEIQGFCCFKKRLSDVKNTTLETLSHLTENALTEHDLNNVENFLDNFLQNLQSVASQQSLRGAKRRLSELENTVAE